MSKVYDDFIHFVVVPLLDCGELLYQRPPTLRCQMPGLGALSSKTPAPGVVSMTRAHRDSDFAAHHGAEINFWIPVTRVWGSNSLYAESAPELQDFHAFELSYGEMAIFNGSRCLHYTEANRTDAVRVSFDFRVIPKSLAKGWRHATGKHELAQYDFVSSKKAVGF